MFKKTITTLLTTSQLWTNVHSAGQLTTLKTPEELYNSTYTYYTENRTTLTPRVLGRIEYQLKQIITDQNTTQEVLANTACLLFALDCTSSYTKACNVLFHRPDFNPKLYYTFIKRIRQLSTQNKNNI